MALRESLMKKACDWIKQLYNNSDPTLAEKRDSNFREHTIIRYKARIIDNGKERLLCHALGPQDQRTLKLLTLSGIPSSSVTELAGISSDFPEPR